MIFGKELYGRGVFGDLGAESSYGEAWLALCVTTDTWDHVTPAQSTITDECLLVIVPPPSLTDPAIPPAGASWAGIRIPSVPYDSTYSIVSATLTLTASGNHTGFATIDVHGVLEPNPAVFSGTASVKSRPRTVSKTTWQAPVMSDGVQYSVDVTEPTIEMLAQPGRVAGNAVAYILVGAAGYREFLSTDPDLELVGA